ncbi:winged helix-turn-helix domain-containing protein [uncultured Methanobrevibacter sp.]|uniref:winged helix-turn-helix domain-containing protein n=1 Tax=uncultured Methanobrevibacter sp. TaxID=253161 RepID=UPI00261D9B91
MKILISNLKGKELLDIAMKNRIDKLISVYSNYNETSLLDQYMTKENIKISTTNAIEACKQLTDIIRNSKDSENTIYVATDGNFIGSILNFVANKEGADFIYYSFNNQIIQMPRLSINLSKTKMNILKSLEESEQTAILIGKNVNISRAMVYKHITKLKEDGLVGQTKQYEKYYLTDAGKMIII